MKVGYFQFCPEWGKPLVNRERILRRLSHLSKGEVDLLVLPELAFSGYCFDSVEALRPCTQEKTDAFFDPLAELCAKKETALTVGFAEKETQRVIGAQEVEKAEILYNSALLIDSNGERNLYRKNHLFSTEKRLFSAGNGGFPLFEVKGCRVGILICFDHLFPEAARTLALAGAQVICHPCNLVLPGYASITSASRSLENRIYWILANRFGSEGQLKFSGESRILDPYGRILHRALPAKEELFITEINPEIADDKRLADFNHLFDDRRVDAYRL